MMLSAYEKDKAAYRHYYTADADLEGMNEEILTTPLFSLRVKHELDLVTCLWNTSDRRVSSDHDMAVIRHSAQSVGAFAERITAFQQYGLLGHHTGDRPDIGRCEPLLLNVQAPHSTFICGSQGSGKSYTLSAILENSLMVGNAASHIAEPLAGVVFHYDVNSSAAVAETAYLCSIGVQVNVFVSPSNQNTLTRAYKAIDRYDNVTVQPLLLRSSDLNIERMYQLMAMAEREGPTPLYMEVVQRILRQMAITDSFDYTNFRNQLQMENLTKDQTGPLNLRLSLLESFMESSHVPGAVRTSYGAWHVNGKKGNKKHKRTLSHLQPGTLTIIDLSDTFVDASTACMLFDVALSLVQEHHSTTESGLVIALDEAHKFMNKSPSAERFTDRLLTTIREQRHNATRVVIATQEPTISTKLLDLCSISIVHRFTSPAWFGTIRDHLSGASSMVTSNEERDAMFDKIVNLHVGESLVFTPSSYVIWDEPDKRPRKIGTTAIKMRTRKRIGADGGKSKLACANHVI